MRPLLAGLLIAAAVWPAAAPAAAPASDSPRATVVATPRFVPEAGPVLAGDGTIVWVARRDDSVLDLWQASRAGQAWPARRIQRFVGSDTEWLAAPRLSASGSAVGLELVETAAGTARALRTRSYLGGVGEPLRPVSSCAGAAPAQRSLDVGPLAAVFRGPDCTHVTVRGLGPAAGATRLLPDGAFAARLGGSLEAWLEGPSPGGTASAAVVRDNATGREITRLAAAELPGDITELALSTGGTLALLYRAPPGARTARVAIVAPGATRIRPLALRLLVAQGARWDGDALAVVAASPTDPRRGVLQHVDAGGATTAPVIALGSQRDLMDRTDLVASRAVWVQRGCGHAVIRTIALPAPAVARLRTPTCALRLRRRARVEAGRLRLGVSCAGFAHGCTARVTVRAGSLLLARGTARPNHSTPPYAAADLRLTRAARALLHRRSRIRVQISARIGTTLRRTTRTIARGGR